MNTNNDKNDHNDDKNKYNKYFPICTGIGLLFGTVFNQISIGLCLGVVIGLELDSIKAKS